MDAESFNNQAEKFSRISKQFLEIETIWKAPFLKVYMRNKIDWEMVVLFSHAFNCPVFYFRSRTECLAYDEVCEYLTNNKDFVSAAELPITGEPYYFLHPCNTRNILHENLAAWLSVVLQTLGFFLPMKLYSEFYKSLQDY